jgi:hypothetical protein
MYNKIAIRRTVDYMYSHACIGYGYIYMYVYGEIEHTNIEHEWMPFVDPNPIWISVHCTVAVITYSEIRDGPIPWAQRFSYHCS